MIKGAGVIFISMIGLMIGYLAQLGLMIGPMSGDWEAGLGCQRLESRRPEIGPGAPAQTFGPKNLAAESFLLFLIFFCSNLEAKAYVLK